MQIPKPWIGIDLDGTLAHYDGSTAIIGSPVPAMVLKLKQILAAGQYDVRIFTARASVPGMSDPVRTWLRENDLPDLQITCQKDFQMVGLYDDRAITVIENTGLTVFEHYGIKQ